MQAVKEAMWDPFEYLVARRSDGLLKTDFSRPLGKVSYHVPCHSRVQNIGRKTEEMLKLVARHCGAHQRALLRPRRHLRREEADSHEIAMKIGKPLFKAHGGAPEGGSPTTSAPTARWPATTSTGLRAQLAAAQPEAGASADAGAHGLRPRLKHAD